MPAAARPQAAAAQSDSTSQGTCVDGRHGESCSSCLATASHHIQASQASAPWLATKRMQVHTDRGEKVGESVSRTGQEWKECTFIGSAGNLHRRHLTSDKTVDAAQEALTTTTTHAHMRPETQAHLCRTLANPRNKAVFQNTTHIPPSSSLSSSQMVFSGPCLPSAGNNEHTHVVSIDLGYDHARMDLRV